MKPWIEPPEITIPEALRTAVGGHPLVAARLVRHGLTAAGQALAFLNPNFYSPAPAEELPGLAKAAERIVEGIRNNERICIWGDIDVDGQTSTAILTGTLADLGADVTYHVPVRENESHGVNLPVLRKLIEAGARLILTCDTGITAHAAADYARRVGVEMVITDHHQPQEQLPAAAAIVNPKLLPAGHPLGQLPGAGLAYKLAESLYARMWPHNAEAVLRHLDLAALGIVADLAMQSNDTRYLLQRGLASLHEARRPGLRMLMESAGLDPIRLTEEHISFMLAPRLNAVGRLADANVAVDLLTLGEAGGGSLSTAELASARILVDQIELLNARRKLLCDQVYAAAEAQIAGSRELQRAPVLVLSHPAWPAGVIGIVASRLVEQYARPAVLISAPHGQMARGSARSIEGINITDAIAASAGLLDGFGGHPMAAGLSLAPERIPDFGRALSRTVAGMQVEPAPGLQTDGYLTLDELSLSLVEDLERLAPFGPGNPPLTLVTRELEIAQARTVGRNDDHRLLTVRAPGGAEARAIWWDGARRELPTGRVDLAYTVRTSDYRGEREVEISWIDARPAESTSPIELAPARAEIQVTDYRDVADAALILASLVGSDDLAVWREGPAASEMSGGDRYTLPRATSLAVWTTPPGPVELRAVIERVAPSHIYLFDRDPDLDRPSLFMRRLAGLVKHVLGEQLGLTALPSLAAATAQREAVVLAGLEWLVARGDIRMEQESGGQILLSEGEATQKPIDETAVVRCKRLLEVLLAETAAYRAYFRSARPDALLPRS